MSASASEDPAPEPKSSVLLPRLWSNFRSRDDRRRTHRNRTISVGSPVPRNRHLLNY